MHCRCGRQCEKAGSNRHVREKIIVIDGCPLACAKACLNNHSIQPDVHIELTSFGVAKRQHENFNKHQADEIMEILEVMVDEGPVMQTI